MADKFSVDVALAVEGLFEREDDQHLVDVLLDFFDAAFLPGPELGADEEDDRDAKAVELFGQGEVDVGEVDEDGQVWFALADGGFELAEFGVDAGEMADDFRDAHDGYVFCADDAVKACFDHARTAHAYETELGWGLLAEGFHQ